MRIQISSGQGPAECEKAVALFSEAIKAEYPDMKLISSVKGHYKDCFCSVIMEAEQDVSFLAWREPLHGFVGVLSVHIINVKTGIFR